MRHRGPEPRSGAGQVRLARRCVVTATEGTLEHVRVDLGPPLARLVSTNRAAGEHWGKHHSDKVLWRDGMATLAKVHSLDRRIRGRACLVRFAFPVPDKRRRDPANLVGTVVKWAVDGLVLGGVWPDDSPEYVSVIEPLLIPGGHTVVLELWLRTEAFDA